MFCYPSDILGHSVCGPTSSPLSVPTGKSSTLVTLPDGLFDAPRDDTARASCGNGAKIEGLPIQASAVGHHTSFPMRLPYLATLLLTSLSGISAASSIPESYGPIGYPGISPRVTEAGVEAPNFHFDPLLVPKPRAWESQWIWLPKGNAPVVCFRKEILFESPPKRVQAWVSAHNS
jgi:hypothetical protein